MAERAEEFCLRLQVLNPQHQPLGGTVDITCKLQNAIDASYIDGANAAHDIDVRGLRRDPGVPYKVTVTPNGTSLAMTQAAAVPATGFAAVPSVIDKDAATGAAARYRVNRTLALRPQTSQNLR